MTRTFLRSPFVAFCLGMLIILAYPVMFFSKGDLVLLVNQHHTVGLDLFFKYITHLGDGMVMAILIVGLLFYSYKLAILTAFSIIFQSIIVSIFKRWLFKGLARPTAFMEDVDWHFIEGVNVHGSNTFPSGHTTTGFALFALLVLIFHNRSYLLSLLLFTLALLVGFSRIYLLQHFVIDVYFGAVFGLLSVIFALILMDYFFSNEKQEKLQSNSLYTTLFRK